MNKKAHSLGIFSINDILSILNQYKIINESISLEEKLCNLFI